MQSIFLWKITLYAFRLKLENTYNRNISRKRGGGHARKTILGNCGKWSFVLVDENHSILVVIILG
jgi:hypothetical protein